MSCVLASNWLWPVLLRFLNTSCFMCKDTKGEGKKQKAPSKKDKQAKMNKLVGMLIAKLEARTTQPLRIPNPRG